MQPSVAASGATGAPNHRDWAPYASHMLRPDPMRWVYFQYRGRLPERYRDWVLHDGTCRTWVLRVFVRSLVQVSPLVVAVFAGLVLVADAPVALAAGSVLLGVLVAVRYTLSYAEESVDFRLVRNGFPPGHGSAVRREKYQETHADEAERYRSRWQSPEV